MDDNQKSGSRQAVRRIGFPAAAILLSLLPFVLVELGLRAFNVGNPRKFDDRLVGFSEMHPLFDLDRDKHLYRTTASRRLYFGQQEFTAEKADNCLRVFCLGGSTVRGRPYETETAFPQWLALELANCAPDRRYEIVNCGGLSYASYRLRVILREVLEYRPDLVILATGHNEFLEDRTYQELKARSPTRSWIEDRAYTLRLVTTAQLAWGSLRSSSAPQPGRSILSESVEARLDQGHGYASYRRDPNWRDGVVRHFRRSLQAMIVLCQDADVPLILVKLGSNLRDTPPFKSEHRAQLTTDQERSWQSFFDAASALDADHPERARSLYQKAANLDSEYALLSFRLARCLDRLGRHGEADNYYRRARDDDICPLRMPAEMSHAIDELEQAGTLLVDADQLLRDTSSAEIPGNDRYMDHVHPSIHGHQLIAQAIVRTMRHVDFSARANWPVQLDEWDSESRRQAYRDHWLQLPTSYLADGRRRVAWLERWAGRNRLLHEALPINADGYLRRGLRQLSLDDTDQAWLDFRTALQADPATAGRLVQHALEQFQEGRPAAAAQLLERLNQEPAAEPVRHEIELALERVRREV